MGRKDVESPVVQSISTCNVLLTTFQMHFLILPLIPCYINFATFSKDLFSSADALFDSFLSFHDTLTFPHSKRIY
jgi:hypothetical protein